MSGGGVLFGFIPRFNQSGLVSRQNPGDVPEFRLAKALVPAQLRRSEPEFGLVLASFDMDMCRFLAFVTEEVEPAVSFVLATGWEN